jgi:hypothetical protein
VDIRAGLTYSGNTVVVSANGWGSCSTGSCHNATGGTNVTWTSAPTDCNQCHYSASADANNWSGQDRVAAMIYRTEYTAAETGGHGSASYGAPAGGRNISKACAGTCHDLSAVHDTTTNLSGGNPFRLVAGFSCMMTAGCHTAGTLGAESGVDLQSIVSHTNEAMLATGYTTKRTWPAWDPLCMNCHDPHGDGNLSMIARAIYEATFNLPAGPPPAYPTEATALSFWDNTTGQSTTGYSYADSDTPFASLCQVCHEAANHQAFRDGLTANTTPHTATTDSGSCHKHDKAFQPGACNGCHQSETYSGGYWPQGSVVPDRGGRHQRHMEEIALRLTITLPGTDTQQKQMCEYCHAAVTNDYDHGSNGNVPAEVFVTTVSGASTRYARALWGASDTGASYTVGNGTNGVCWTTDCHGDKVTTSGTYGWYNANTTACIMCHDDIQSTGVATGATHQAHVGSSTGSGALCADCHAASTWGSPGTAPSDAAGHVNGTFRVSGSVGFSYTGAYPTSFGTCGINACHNSGKNGTPRTSSYTWGTAIGGTNSCTECHYDTSATLTTQSHPAHLMASTS